MKSQKQNTDYFLIFIVFGLVLFGLLMVYDASVVEAYHKFADKHYFLKNQLIWAGIGLASSLIFAKIDYHRWQVFAAPLMFMTITLLALVLIPSIGIKVLGAKRWINIAGVSLQPGELAKLAFVLYFAAWLSKEKRLLPLLLVAILTLTLILLEPDLGTAVVVIFSGFLVYFVSGAPFLHLILSTVLGFLAVSLLIYLSPYRRRRLMTFFDPSKDPLGASYHIRQILLAIGSGGLWGVGLGKSRQKYEYLPAATTDSIFAVIAEETGFMGSLLVIIAFLFLIWRGIKIAKEAPDFFGQLLATGIIGWIATQALVNLAAMVALVPLTGVPLPFISYGGSSLVVTLTGMGILLNIAQQKVVKR